MLFTFMSVCNSSLSESFALNFQEIPIYKWEGMNSYTDLQYIVIIIFHIFNFLDTSLSTVSNGLH